MKRITLLFSIIAGLALMSCEKETVVAQDQLPSEISTYISTHFPSNAILQTIKERDGLTKSYDVILEGNISLEFNRKYEIQSIESLTKLPDSVVPARVLEYVTTHYASNFIREWELDDNRQKVELDNRLELEFSKSGDFLRID